MIEQGLFQLITSDPGVQSVVGPDANGTPRAFWILAPQGTKLPMLVLSRVGTVDKYTFAGSSGLRESIFQVSCYASNFADSRAVSKRVKNALENFKGILPDADRTEVTACLVDKDFDLRYEEGSKGFIYAAILHFRIWFLE